MMPRGVFITGTGTGVGKTWVARGLARALTRGGQRVRAVKPLETGWLGPNSDASALDHAAHQSACAQAPGLYRASAPVSPRAATLGGEAPPPSFPHLRDRIAELAQGVDFVVVEGAGGLLVPVTASETIAHLAQALALPLVLVASDALGTLSHTLTAFEAAAARNLDVAAVVVSCPPSEPPPHPTHNAAILREHLSCPILDLGPCTDSDEGLADAIDRTGLARLCLE